MPHDRIPRRAKSAPEDAFVPATHYDPRTGAEPFRLEDFASEGGMFEPERSNLFAVRRIAAGSGHYCEEDVRHPCGPGTLLFAVPYRHVRFESAAPLRGTAMLFHANFLCVETFHAETGCAGTLFADPYGRPTVVPDPRTAAEIDVIFTHFRRELAERATAYREALLAHLKLLLILAVRAKAASVAGPATGHAAFRHPVLESLRELVEANYRTLHAPADYAALLHVTPKTLGRLVREHWGKTLSDLIRDRILTHAKRELLHSLKTVKEIAQEVGFRDEAYFSRAFKQAVGLSPLRFRTFETEIRAGFPTEIRHARLAGNPSILSSE